MHHMVIFLCIIQAALVNLSPKVKRFSGRLPAVKRENRNLTPHVHPSAMPLAPCTLFLRFYTLSISLSIAQVSYLSS